MTAPRLVFTSAYADLGGGELRLLDYLGRTRFERRLLSAVVLERGPLRERLAALGVDATVIPWHLAHRRPVRRALTALASARLARHLRRHAAELVFCNTYSDLRLAGPVARRLGIPVIWRSRAELFPSLDALPVERRAGIVGMIRRTVTRVLTTTAYDHRLALAAGLVPGSVHVVPQGVDRSRFAGGLAARRAMRATLGIPADVVLLGFVGRLVPQKGHMVFLDALARVVAERPDVRALVVGDAATDRAGQEFRRALDARAASLGLSGAIVLTGFRDDVPAVMNAVDLFVHASLKEPFGMVIVEAMAAGKPVVASRTPGPEEILEDGVTGLLVPPGDAEALAAGILRLLHDPALAARIADAASRHVRRTYDLTATVEQLDTHILETLDRGIAADTVVGARVVGATT